MLILPRLVGEKIMIGDDIVLTVLSITSDRKKQVRLGITAPKDVLILRDELLDGGKKKPVDDAGKDR